MTGEDPGVVGLDGTGTKGSSCRSGDDDGYVLLCEHHLTSLTAERGT